MSLARRIGALTRSTCTIVCQPSPAILAQTRSKHSSTQVKRLFKNNPARLRLLKKASSSDNERVQIPERKYPQVFQPKFLQNGWSAPPPADFQAPEYPFHIKRTGRKPFGAAGFLPVYRDVR